VTEAGATVLVDDRERGTTPLSGPIVVAAGSHRLRIVKQGRVPFERRIDIAGQQTLEVDAELMQVVAPTAEPRPKRAPAPLRNASRTSRIEPAPAPAPAGVSPFVAVELGALVSPGLGGELAARCEGSCSAPLALGGGAFVAGGVAFSSGLDVGAEIGVLRLGASYEDRPDPIVPWDTPATVGQRTISR
jgi:hypothetical protein